MARADNKPGPGTRANQYQQPPPPPPPPPLSDSPTQQFLSLEYLKTHPVSYVLGHPPFVLFAAVIALLVYVLVQAQRHREETRQLGLRVRQLCKDGEFVVQALQVSEERVERLGVGVDRVEDVVLEVSRCVREALGDVAAGGRLMTTAAGKNTAAVPVMGGRGGGGGGGGAGRLLGTKMTTTTLTNNNSSGRRGLGYNTVDLVDRRTRDDGVVGGGTVSGYDTVDDDDDDARTEVGEASRYAESAYTAREGEEYEEPEEEDDDEWERRTMTTEVESRRSNRPGDKRRREQKIWSKGDWKGLEVFG